MSFIYLKRIFLISSIYGISIISVCFSNDNSNIDLLTNARELIFLNRIDQAEEIINKIDTISLDEYEMAVFHLTNGFFQYKQGNKNRALENLRQASLSKDQYFNHGEKAELYLILGLVFENALLNSEAAKSFFSALEQFREKNDSDKYFMALLGVARTSSDGLLYLEEASSFLSTHNSSRNQLLFLNTKANLTENIHERNELVLRSMHYFDEKYDLVKQIALFSSIALNYQILENPDSAFFYLKKIEILITKFEISTEKILHYYTIKAYIQSMNFKLEEALLSVDKIIDHGKDSPGLLSQAYLRRSYIHKKQGDYQSALSDMQEHVKFQTKEYKKAQKHQLGLLSIQYQLQQKELELAKIKNAWLLTGIILILGLIIIWVLFYYYRKRSKQIKKELQKKYNLASNRLTEQVEHNIISAQLDLENGNNEKPGQKKENVPGLEKQEFNMLFNIEHPLFREKLNKAHPELTQSDLKYCDCLLAELTVFQTTRVLGVSVSAVKKARKKLRKIFTCDTTEELGRILKKLEKTPYDSV